MRSRCLPSSAPTQPFRQGYSMSLSLTYYLVWASACYLTHCAATTVPFFFRLHRISISLKFILCSYCHLGPLFSWFLSTWLSCQDTVGSLVTLQLFQLLRPQIFCGDGTVTSVSISRECIVCKLCQLTAFSRAKFSLAGQHHPL